MAAPGLWTAPRLDQLLALVGEPVPLVPTIEPWVWHRFNNLVVSGDVRYEASFYGPLTSLMTSIFTHPRRFMIKPQATIRPSVDAQATEQLDNLSQQTEDGDEYEFLAANISIDSQGDTVAGRLLIGHEAGKRSPDFTIVKTDSGATLKGDKLLGVVEVKRDDLRIGDATHQLVEYMKACANKSRAPNMDGFLVAGPITLHFQLSSERTDAEVIELDEFDTASAHFVQQLHRIARSNWN